MNTGHTQPRRKRRSILIASALLSIGCLCLWTAQAESRTVTVAVVQDGPSAESEFVPRIEAELGQFVSVEATIRFKTDPAFDAAWDPKRVRRAVRAALADREVDLILGIGSLVTYEAARPELNLTKPFVSTFVQRADILRLPYSKEGRPLKKNFSFMVAPQRAERDLRTFRELIPFRTLHVAVTAEDLKYADGVLTERLKAFAAELGMQIVPVSMTDDVAESISRFGPDVEAVYLTRLARLSPEERSRFIQGMTARKIPTFSMLGHADVERGALAGLTADISEQVVRRAALNLSRLSRGASTADLPVTLPIASRLLINGETARATGYSPSPDVWILSSFLHREALMGDTEALTYADALKAAESANTSLAVKDKQVEGVRQDVVRARSTLLPQVLGQISYLAADSPISPLEGIVPDDALFGGIVVSQSIFDDKRWTLYRASRHLAEVSEHQRESSRLDVLRNAGATFMNLGLARALYRIQAGNVELTEDFLEIAKLRVDFGISGQEDVLLWESVRARQKGALFTAAQKVRSVQTILNQIMSVEQDRSWQTEDQTDDWKSFFALTQRIIQALENMDSVERFRGIAAEIALREAPEIAALDEAVAAQRLRLNSAKRSFWLPSFAANFGYINELTGETVKLPGADDDFWTAEVRARYPLFEGGRRFGNKGRAKADLEGLRYREALAREMIELNTRTVVEATEGLYPRIGFNQTASAAAQRNLEIVTDQYAEGAKNITDLLSAQNNYFIAEQLTVTAIYEFLGQLVQLQRALSWFEYDRSLEEQEELFREIEDRLAGS